MSANPYDAVPYESHAYLATHPNRLATVATLFGLSPAPPTRCRVLEIGCAGGGNLLPMAVAFPESRFVGIDYSAVQIAEAEQARTALGLPNIEFRCEDVRAVDAKALGKFDYVIAHGIYSWLPPEAQTAMLALYRDCLAPAGVGFISYNTLPGWRMRGIVRDIMRFHAELFGSPQTQVAQARALIDFMTQHVPSDNNPYGQYLKSELGLLANVSDSYVLHEHLETHNEPLYFRDFMARAQGMGLHYLGESEFGLMVGCGIAPEAYQRLKTEITDIVRIEQYMDFLRNRTFRQTLLVKNGAAIQRNIIGERLLGLHVSANLSPEGNDFSPDRREAARFLSPQGQTLTVANPVTKSALMCLAEEFPATLPIDDLARLARERLSATHRSSIAESHDRSTLLADLLVATTASGLLYLSASPLHIAPRADACPQGWRYARWQAERGPVVTSLRHETVRLSEPGRFLLPLLDGSRDRAALRVAFFGAIRAGSLQLQRNGGVYDPPDADDPLVAAALDAVLAELARTALLLRP